MEGGGIRVPGEALKLPAWYRRRYPTMDDLVAALEAREAIVAWAPIHTGLFVAGDGDQPAVVVVPSKGTYLSRCWILAHELAHLVLHAGPRGRHLAQKDEAAADRWAAQALIPRARVLHHGNASLDAFIGALSAHYGPIEPDNGPDRVLAARIAGVRLRWLEVG